MAQQTTTLASNRTDTTPDKQQNIEPGFASPGDMAVIEIISGKGWLSLKANNEMIEQSLPQFERALKAAHR